MIQSVVAEAFSRGETTGDRRRPEDQILFQLIVVKNLRRPAIDRSRLMRHHGNSLLLRPADQVFRVRDPDVLSAPSRSPDHVEDSVRTLNNAGIAHQLLTPRDRKS